MRAISESGSASVMGNRAGVACFWDWKVWDRKISRFGWGTEKAGKRAGVSVSQSKPMAEELGDLASREESEWEGATAGSKLAAEVGKREGKRQVLGLR